MLSQNTEVSQSLDGKNVLAQILKRMDPATESNLIATLSDEDPELGADIRRRLFTEEDLVNADDRYLQNKLHDMDDKTIAVLIKGKKADFRSKILSNLSKRRAENVLDEESMTEFLLKSESERVTSQFFADLRRAWESGEMRVSGRDDSEIWVQ
jgi:flagellar motor switch protein FliG